MNAALRTGLICAALIVTLAGCASTSASVNAGGSNRGAAGAASVSTGIKF